MCKSFISIIKVPFSYSLRPYSSIKLYRSVDSHIFRRLYADKHILNLNKAISMQFSQNKAWYPVLITWNSLGKNHITSIFNILFQKGPVLFDSPRIFCLFIKIIKEVYHFILLVINDWLIWWRKKGTRETVTGSNLFALMMSYTYVCFSVSPYRLRK